MSLSKENQRQFEAMKHNIRILREREGLSREQLAEAVGVPVSEIISAENEGNLYADTFLRIAALFKVKPYQMFDSMIE